MYFISLARRKSLPSIRCFPGPLLIFLGFTLSSSFGVESSSHGTVRKAFRSAAALCLPLLRSDRHQRLFERIVSARASGSFLSPGDRHSHPEQGGDRSALPMTTRSGCKPLPATTRSPSSGAKKVSVKRIMFCPGCAECARRAPTECTGSVYYAGVKIHETRIIRLLEVLLHAGNNLGGWSAKHIYQVILQSFQLSQKAYGLNQLRYDLRKLKGHGLLERDGSRYAYRLTSKGFQVALLFLFFHKRLCGPLANSRFHHQPDADHRPKSKLEAAYYKADRAIQDIVNLLDAA